ncbi:hypothetical protein GCM10007036_26690 [Alsobacter metallidurans]|uniref:Sec-independent protein translocase protein TatB n=1 Tax=Alsobacter metallidurans TaxID=340221 RepID=A0A917I944_9HYPH|nr:Sec-independent protein translocase protein TatB [Alsobacter metallidurans]GGH21991.1 hypothetical protein GCM10007036_26690 [Alsobacter metallidurans]
MFDIGWGEFVVIGVVALIVIGPKELPSVLRTVGKTVGKVKRMAGEFQGQFQDAIREMDIEDARKTVEGIHTDVSSSLNTGFNPIQTIRDEIKAATETPASGAAALPETNFNIPEPPPVPDLTPEQIQAAFAPVVPSDTPSGEGAFEVAAGEPAPPKPKRTRKKADAAATESTPADAPATDADLAAPVMAVSTAPVTPEAVEAAAAPAKPKRRAPARKTKTTDDEGSA